MLQISRTVCEGILDQNKVSLDKNGMALVGIRGYTSKNKIGLFDDALVWLDQETIGGFNGNTDPSRYFNRVATLACGVWRYKKGDHGSKVYGPYPAFRQAAPVTVLRFDGKKPAIEDTGMFGINIHHGSKKGSGTSSLGCQTLPYAQWNAFREFGYMLIKKHAVKDFPYVLVEWNK